MKMNKRSHRRQVRYQLAGVVLLLVLIVLGTWSWRVGSLTLSLRGRALRLQQLAADRKRASLARPTLGAGAWRPLVRHWVGKRG
jgi:cell division protein FtsB